MSTRLKIALAAVAAVIIAGAILLVVHQSGSSHKAPAKWVVVPQASLHGPDTNPGTEPGPTSITTSTSEPAPSPQTVTLGANVVTVPVPEGWTNAVSDDKTNVDLKVDGYGAYISVVPNNELTADAYVTSLVTSWVYNDSSITSVKPDDNAVAVPVSGDVTGGARFYYSATSVNGSPKYVGNLFAYTRNDGWVMAIRLLASGTDPDDAGSRLTSSDAIKAILNGAFASFSHT